MRLTISLLVLASTLLLPVPVVRAAEKAGVSAAVRGDVALTREAVAVGRQVVSGEPILLQDAIKSGQRSGMQILLLDETVFTIGPESELVIDEFVYDPKTSAGKLGARVTRGVFRFVSGKIAHEKPEDMNLKLPSGTLGVRGTMVAGRVDPAQKSSRLVLLGEGPENDTGAPAGAFEACNAGECVRINRPGFGTRIDGPEAPPVAPFRFTQEEIDALTRSVSDPEGGIATASAGGGTTPGVAAGPEGEAGRGGVGVGTATEASGIRTAAGSGNGETTRTQLRSFAGLQSATTSASQFAEQTVQVNGSPLSIRTGCTDLRTCALELYGPGGGYTLPGGVDVTTIDQLVSLGATGLQTAIYQQSGLGLIGTNGQRDGSYDFSLVVSPSSLTADLQIMNLRSSLLGLSGVSFGEVLDIPTSALGFGLPFVVGASDVVTGAVDGPCENGCDAAAVAQLENANGRIADAALHSVVIVAPPDPTSGIVDGTVSENPYAPIPRP